jgi:hypothetical protein
VTSNANANSQWFVVLCRFLSPRLGLISGMSTRKLGKYIMLETLGQGGFSKSVQ